MSTHNLENRKRNNCKITARNNIRASLPYKNFRNTPGCKIIETQLRYKRRIGACSIISNVRVFAHRKNATCGLVRV